MAVQLQLRSGTTTEHNTFTGANGEVTVDTTNKTLRVHDGSTVGGIRLATLTGGLVPTSQLPDATTSVKGAVILNNTLASTSTTQALTANMGNYLNDKFNNKSFGIGQTWQDMTSSRVSGTTYTNTTGRPIQLHIMTGTESSTFNIGASTLPAHGNSMIQSTVPDSSTYSFSGVVVLWWELR
jgi:hypothetical protein